MSKTTKTAAERAQDANRLFDELSAVHCAIVGKIVDYAYGASGDFSEAAEAEAATYHRIADSAAKTNFSVATKAERAVRTIETAFSRVLDFGLSIGWKEEV